MHSETNWQMPIPDKLSELGVLQFINHRICWFEITNRIYQFHLFQCVNPSQKSKRFYQM